MMGLRKWYVKWLIAQLEIWTEKSELQPLLSAWLVRDLYNLVDESELVKIVSLDNVQRGGHRLAPEAVQSLGREASEFADTTLWKSLLMDIRWQGGKALERSKTVEDIVAGKMLFYLAELLERKVHTLKKL